MDSSVLADFSEAWTHRFGSDCQLPAAWEDDVRANLWAHQAKVTALKQELEKEEFYVHYLQKLLQDVDRTKAIEVVDNDNQCSDSLNENQKDDQYVTVITVSNYGQIETKPLIDNPLYQTCQPLQPMDDTNPLKEAIIATNDLTKKKRPPTPPRKPRVNTKLTSMTTNQVEDNNNGNELVIPSLATTGEVDMNDKNGVNQIESNPMSDDVLYDDDLNNIYDTVAPDEPSQRPNTQHVNKQVTSDLLDSNSSTDNLSTKYDDMNSYANYVNIDYFLRKDDNSWRDDSDDNETQVSQSLSSDHEIEDNVTSLLRDSDLIKSGLGLMGGTDISLTESQTKPSLVVPTYDEVFESDPGNTNILDNESQLATNTNTVNGVEVDRITMYKCIIASITDSESVYVDCLNTLIQYMKALKSTLGTTHPLLSPEELTTIFYKIPELYSIHSTFLEGLKKLSNSGDESNANAIGSTQMGELFKVLASRLGAYSAFLKNYSKALETVHKCSATNNQFSEITRSIKIISLKGQTVTLEELLHKPVARVQKNALVLHDLLKYTNEDINEYKSLKTALKMTQCFLNDLNIAATEQMFPIQDKTQRRLVKESFIVESSDDKRKLRHLFLFNDVIVCAKYKAATKQKFTFELKSYNMLNEITVLDTEIECQSTTKEKENNNNLLNIKSRVSNTRDLITREEEKEKGKLNTKLLDKLKKKKSDLEAHLVLYLPQLKFCISHKSGKIYTFYLSSEFERSQWIESIKVLQQSAQTNKNSYESINFHELQAWIETCRKNLNPNSLGSFLLRSSKDEDLLFGDLYLNVKHLKGLSREADIFFILEMDTYGHYLQRCVTNVSRQSVEPHFDQDFVVDVEGTQTLRILCYEQITGQQKPFFRGKASLELSQTWLTDKQTIQLVPILDCILTLSIRFVSWQSQTGRFPASKVCGTFGLNVQQVCKKEKTTVPYLISCCIKEVERRGVKEVGIYRVSGLSSDVQKLKKSFETNPYEADLLVKEIDIHAVTGLLKLYLRELPESLFTNAMYKKYFDAFNLTNQSDKSKRLLSLLSVLPQPNQSIVITLIDHLYKVNECEEHNKMSLHNLATVFGPTVLRPGTGSGSGGGGTAVSSLADSFTAGTIDVMAQAGILYFFLRRRASGISLTTTETQL